MVLNFFFLITDILSSQYYISEWATFEYLSSETFSLSNFQSTFNQVRSLKEYALHHVSRNVKLFFKDKEIFEINYSELKRFYFFRNEFMRLYVLYKVDCYFLSTFSLSAFKIIMKTFDMLDDLDVLIEFINYNDLGHIFDLAILLYPNPLSKQIFQDLMKNHKDEMDKLKRRLDNENLDEITLEMGITKSLSKENYFNFIKYILVNSPYNIDILVERLNIMLKDEELQFLQFFLVNYSRFNDVLIVFNDIFFLKINIEKDDDLQSTETSECSEFIDLIFICPKTVEIDLEKYISQIYFVIDIYKRGLGNDINVICTMNSRDEDKNGQRLITLLKEKYELQIIQRPSYDLNYKGLGLVVHSKIIYVPEFLGIKFEEPTLLETINKKCSFINIDNDSVYDKCYS